MKPTYKKRRQIMKATYKSHCGTDLDVVNAARVSFNKEHIWKDCIDENGKVLNQKGTKYGLVPQLSTKDQRLIKYLAEHKHWTPFAHNYIRFHIRAPIFVARQLGKHQVGLVWNEVSRRYVNVEPEFYWPEYWRKPAANKKQGSEGQADTGGSIDDAIRDKVFALAALYKNFVDPQHGTDPVCPEQARMILPQNMYTEWWWSGNLAAWARVCNLRMAPDAQAETREIAGQISEVCATLFPYSWKELVKYQPEFEDELYTVEVWVEG